MEDEVSEWNDLIKNWPDDDQMVYKRLKTKEGLPNILLNVEKNGYILVSSLRSVIWNLLLFHKSSSLYSNLPEYASTEDKLHTYYQSLIIRIHESKYIKEIEKDLLRSAPKGEYKSLLTEDRITQLRNILLAYSLHDEELGYCQGLNFVAFMLLLTLSEEEAFWALIALLNGCNIRDIYNPESDLLHVLLTLIEEEITFRFPRLANHLKNEGIEVAMYAVDWITTFFVYSLSLETNTRIWDFLLFNAYKGAMNAISWLLNVSVSIIHLLHDQFMSSNMELIMTNLKLSVSNLPTKLLLSTALDYELSKGVESRLQSLFAEKSLKCHIM